MAAVSRRNTNLEIVVRRALHFCGLRFRLATSVTPLPEGRTLHLYHQESQYLLMAVFRKDAHCMAQDPKSMPSFGLIR